MKEHLPTQMSKATFEAIKHVIPSFAVVAKKKKK